MFSTNFPTFSTGEKADQHPIQSVNTFWRWDFLQNCFRDNLELDNSYNCIRFLWALEVVHVDILASVFLWAELWFRLWFHLKVLPGSLPLNGSLSLWQISPLSQAASLSTRWEPSTMLHQCGTQHFEASWEWLGLEGGVWDSIIKMHLKVSILQVIKNHKRVSKSKVCGYDEDIWGPG